MMGWHITVYREQDPKNVLAQWQSGVHGLNWLDPLVREGHAVVVSKNGYPSLYKVKARVLVPMLRIELPSERNTWIAGPDDVIDHAIWKGKSTRDRSALAKSPPDEWLMVEAWDES